MSHPVPSDGSTPPDTASPSTSPPNGSTPTSIPSADTQPSPSRPMAVSPSDQSPPTHPELTIRDIPLAQIRVADPANGRLSFDHEGIASLAAQIRTTGLINPIRVTLHDGNYELVAGRRRLAAYHQLGLPTIPATIQHGDERAIKTARLAENTARSQLTAVEEAMQIADLVELHPDAVEGVAADIGRSVNWVLDRLEIRNWPDELQAAVHDRHIAIGAAKHLARIADVQVRTIRIHDAIRNGINTRTADLWRRDANATEPQETNVSEKGVQNANFRNDITVNAVCTLCRRPSPIAQTLSVRVCNDCLSGLDAVHQAEPMKITNQEPNSHPDHETQR